MSDEAVKGQFLAALKRDRYDRDTRLIFSDWLEERGLDEEAAEQRRLASPEWIAADRWLRGYAVKHNPHEAEKYDRQKGEYVAIPDGEEKAFALLMEGLRSGELFFHGSDLHSLDELDDAEELKRHADVWLGRSILGWDEFSFSCSC